MGHVERVRRRVNGIGHYRQLEDVLRRGYRRGGVLVRHSWLSEPRQYLDDFVYTAVGSPTWSGRPDAGDQPCPDGTARSAPLPRGWPVQLRRRTDRSWDDTPRASPHHPSHSAGAPSSMARSISANPKRRTAFTAHGLISVAGGEWCGRRVSVRYREISNSAIWAAGQTLLLFTTSRRDRSEVVVKVALTVLALATESNV